MSHSQSIQSVESELHETILERQDPILFQVESRGFFIALFEQSPSHAPLIFVWLEIDIKKLWTGC